MIVSKVSPILKQPVSPNTKIAMNVLMLIELLSSVLQNIIRISRKDSIKDSQNKQKVDLLCLGDCRDVHDVIKDNHTKHTCYLHHHETCEIVVPSFLISNKCRESKGQHVEEHDIGEHVDVVTLPYILSHQEIVVIVVQTQNQYHSDIKVEYKEKFRDVPHTGAGKGEDESDDHGVEEVQPLGLSLFF